MTVTWDRIGRPDKPSRYPFAGGTLTVRQDEIDVWQKYPRAFFHVVVSRPLVGVTEYGLTSCELPEGEDW